MMLKYTGGNVTPPDKFKFTCPHCGYKPDPQFALEPLQQMVRQHYVDNEHPMPDDLRAYVEDQICQLLPAGWSAYGDGTEPLYHVDLRINPYDVLNGTRVLLELTRQALTPNWLGGYNPLVTQEEAARRSLICSRCHFNVTVEGCASCHGIANMVAEVAGGITTPSDPYLRGCAICHCSNVAQTRLDIRIMAGGVPGEIQAMFDNVPHCWKSQQLRELRLTSDAGASTPS